MHKDINRDPIKIGDLIAFGDADGDMGRVTRLLAGGKIELDNGKKGLAAMVWPVTEAPGLGDIDGSAHR